WGSLGDIRPLFNLANGLSKVGHQVTFIYTSVSDTTYEEYFKNSEVVIKKYATPVVSDSDEYLNIQKAIFSEKNELKQVQTILDRLFVPVEEHIYDAAQRLCEENDIVIGHFFCYPLHIAAKKYKTPYISVFLVHNIITTKNFPPNSLPNFGKTMNKLLWKFVKFLLSKALVKYPNSLEQKVSEISSKNIVDDIWSSNRLNLIAVSPVLAQIQDDWEENYQVCGYLDSDLDREISDELSYFLKNNKLPIYITLGSVTDDIEELKEIFVNAVNSAGCKAIIQLPKKYIQNYDNICFVQSSPYGKVFPYCKAIVHHGGAGTSHDVLKAGVPSIVIPHIGEQKFWASELQKAGVVVDIINREKLSFKNLASAILNIDKSIEVEKKAKNIAQRMKSEDGIKKAVEIITKEFCTH
ncbi:MAG: glycosyltransferase, partial [Arcobacteraceae bacterium]